MTVAARDPQAFPVTAASGLRIVQPFVLHDSQGTCMFEQALGWFAGDMARRGHLVEVAQLRRLARDPSTYCRVAVVGEGDGMRCAGLVVVTLLTQGVREPALWVDAMYAAAPGARELLWGEVTAEARRCGIRQVRWDSPRPGMARLARRHGAQIVSITYAIGVV